MAHHFEIPSFLIWCLGHNFQAEYPRFGRKISGLKYTIFFGKLTSLGPMGAHQIFSHKRVFDFQKSGLIYLPSFQRINLIGHLQFWTLTKQG